MEADYSLLNNHSAYVIILGTARSVLLLCVPTFATSLACMKRYLIFVYVRNKNSCIIIPSYHRTKRLTTLTWSSNIAVGLIFFRFYGLILTPRFLV